MKEEIQIFTFGNFRVQREGNWIPDKAWGREKVSQLLQFLVLNREAGLHKEQIIDRLWPYLDGESGDRDFKVALHGIHKVLEPNRKKREEPKYIRRQGLIYQLNSDYFKIDIDDFDRLISEGNRCLTVDSQQALALHKEALALYKGPLLPQYIFEDWTTSERERLQILSLSTYISAAQLELAQNPTESIRLAQQALKIDPSWEDAYRIQIEAFIKTNNRPMAMKAYKRCKQILEDDYGIEPLPETSALIQSLH